MIDFSAFTAAISTAAHAFNLKATCEVATAVSALRLAYCAWLGLNTWEKRLKRETVHKALASVYKFRGRLEAVRRQWMKAADYANRPRPDDESMASDVQDREYVYNQRWFQADEAYSELEVRLAEVEAIWPHVGLIAARQKLLECKQNLENAFGLYMRSARGKHHFEAPEKMQENYLVVFSSGTADLFKPKLDDAIHAFEQQLRPKLR